MLQFTCDLPIRVRQLFRMHGVRGAGRSRFACRCRPCGGRHPWRDVAERGGGEPKGIVHWAAATVLPGAVRWGGTHVIDNDSGTGIGIQAAPFVAGGLIQAAVGLAGGTGFFRTNRSGLVRKA